MLFLWKFIYLFTYLLIFGGALNISEINLPMSVCYCVTWSVPYYCAENSAVQATRCMENPDDTNMADLLAYTQSFVTSGDIDATSNINNDRVFLFAGTLDTVVDPGRHITRYRYTDRLLLFHASSRTKSLYLDISSNTSTLFIFSVQSI